MIGTKLDHQALFYENDEDYVSGLDAFVRAGLDADEAVMVAVPGRNLDLLRAALGDGGAEVRFADMRKQGTNPARILPFIRGFIDSRRGRPVRFVGEPIWAGRTAEEIAESHRHEALINEAFANARARIICPYDLRSLDPSVILDAERTHPRLVRGGRQRPSPRYTEPLVVYAAEDRPLPEPSAASVGLELDRGLASFRRMVAAHARPTGIDAERIAGFVLAANEAAANTLAHAGGTGSARLWYGDWSVVCEISDGGRIVDPLVGRRAPPPDQEHGRGVWLMNQLCDLVELRSGKSGTVVRIHMRLH